MILFNKFLRIRDPYVLINRNMFGWKGNYRSTKFSIEITAINQVVYINRKNIIANYIGNRPLSTYMKLHFYDAELVEIFKHENEVLHQKTRVVVYGPYRLIHFNIKTFLAWSRHKKHNAYRKKILQWI